MSKPESTMVPNSSDRLQSILLERAIKLLCRTLTSCGIHDLYNAVASAKNYRALWAQRQYLPTSPCLPCTPTPLLTVFRQCRFNRYVIRRSYQYTKRKPRYCAAEACKHSLGAMAPSYAEDQHNLEIDKYGRLALNFKFLSRYP